MLTYCATKISPYEEDRISGEPSHQTEPNRTTPWLCEAGSVSRLADDLALALGCPVEVTYLPDTREVLAVAHPEPGREVRVTLPASPIWLRPVDNPYFGLKHDLLKHLRRQIGVDRK